MFSLPVYLFFFNPTCLPVVGPVIKWNSQLQVLKQSPTCILVQLGEQAMGNEAGVGPQTAGVRQGQTRYCYGY